MECDVRDTEALVLALGGRNDRGVADKGIVDTRVGDQVGLEFVEVDVQSTIESQRGRDGADNLSDEAVQVLVRWTRDVEVATADVVHSLVVDKECAVGVLDSAVGGENSVVRLDNGS